MAIWKESPQPRKDAPVTTVEPVRVDATPRPESAIAPAPDIVRSTVGTEPRPLRESRESLIAAEITIEGKIVGAGHVRIAGQFKGDVNVQGNLSIENGAKLTGGVHAATVTVGGELEGNIDSATRVELLETAVLTGDVKAGSLTVAAGSRMRGQVEFGWDDRVASAARTGGKAGSSAA